MERQKSQRSGCLARIARFLIWTVGILAILLFAGYIYQRQITTADFEQYPAPGQLVDVGGYSLHIHCTGQGSPTVIVDAGNGDFSLGWVGIQPEVAKFTRICTYDRAGYGWSDPSPKPRTAKVMADELHTLLSNAGIDPPYILVGHSLGGYTVRMYADLYPDEVTGMILVDAAHEDQWESFPPEFEKLDKQQDAYYSTMGFMARFGILRILGNSSGGADLAPPQILKIPKDYQQLYLVMMSHPAYFDTIIAERKVLLETADQVRATGSLGDMPLLVLTAETTPDPAAMEAIGMSADFDAGRIQQIWYELQAELATLSANGEQIIVKDSTHAIHLDQPEAVIEAIREVVEWRR